MSLPLHSLSLRVRLVTVVLAGVAGSMTGSAGAQIVARPPVKIPASAQDPGARVEMFESPNLDRFLRKAQSFLGKQDYGGAIKVLQDVIEGRTGEFLAQDEAATRTGDGKGKGKTEEKPAQTGSPIDQENPAYSVFSSDERIYRPVARLCHELLASMSAEGVGLYRVQFEAQAQQALEKARSAGDLPGLEAVYNDHFVTLAAGHAMEAAADMLMDAGRFRAAIQTLHHLVDVYPESSRREAGLRDLELMVKMAVCYQQLGEPELAKAELAEAVRVFPEASVRLMGELYTVRDLHKEEHLFAAGAVAIDRPRRQAQALDLNEVGALAPMWEFRFAVPDPYLTRKSTNRRSNPIRIMRGGAGAVYGTRIPSHSEYAPGNTVRFDPQRLVFLDNYRPVVHDLISGRQVLALGAEDLTQPRIPSSNQAPRARTAAYDYFANRVARDESRLYVVEGATRIADTNSFRAIHLNRLVAYDLSTGAEAWAFAGEADSKRPITFLATPTIHRDTLLVPFLEMGSYAMMCLRAVDGREVFRTYLHSGGTHFARAPTPQVEVSSGIAYMLTNAGVVSAVDANTGVLHWSRRYERIDPYHGRPYKAPSSSRRNVGFVNYAYAQVGKFRGFAPSDLIVAGDLVLLAAVDSTALLCLNAANGEILWVHDADEPVDHSVLTAKLNYVVGHNDEFLFVLCGDTQLICVGLRTGLRYWVVNLPGMETSEWRGRGCVTADYVAMPGRPGSRQIHVVPANTKKRPKVRTLELPSFSIGKEPLGGAVNLQVKDAYLAVSYRAGVEVYSAPSALERLAAQSTSVDERSRYLVHAGKLEAAVDLLIGKLDGGDLDADARRRTSIRLLSLVEEVASLLATNGRRDAALELLDRCEKRMGEQRLMLRVHLFRLQVYRTLGDLAGVEREQEFIENGGARRP